MKSEPIGREVLIVCALIMTAFFIRCFVASYHNVMVPDFDGVKYIAISQNILKGYLGEEAINWAPLFPIFLLLGALFPLPLDVTGKYINVVIGSLTILPVFYSVKILFSRYAAVFAAVAYAFCVPLIYSNVLIMSETSYIFVLMMLILTTATILKNSKPSKMMLVAFGVCSGMLYLGRPEGFLAFICFTIILLISNYHQDSRMIKNVLLIFITFFAISLPYILFLTKAVGSFTLSGKVLLNLMNVKTLLGVPDIKQGFFQIYFYNISKTITFMINNFTQIIVQTIREMPLLMLFVPIGIYNFKKASIGGRKTLLLFCASMAPVAANLLYYSDMRLLAPLFSVLSVISGIGMYYIYDRWSHNYNERKRNLLLVLCIIPIIAYPVYHYIELYNDNDLQRQVDDIVKHYKTSGTYLKKYESQGGVLFGYNPNYLVAYYAGMKFINMNVSDINEMLFGEMSRHRSAYLFVDTFSIKKWDKRLMPLLYPDSEEFKKTIYYSRLKIIYKDYDTNAFIYKIYFGRD